MSEITERIQAHRDGHGDWPSLRDWLATRSYPDPERYHADRTQFGGSPNLLDDDFPYDDGTWDEVRRASYSGLLTADEYMEIVVLAESGGAKFDPNQRRDNAGRWTSAGGGGAAPGEPPVEAFDPVGGLDKRAYNRAHGLPEPSPPEHFADIRQDPALQREIADAYNGMPMHDGPEAERAYEAMANEINAQFDYLTRDLGISVEFMDSDPYADVHEMMADVRDNKRLRVMKTEVTGGHPRLSNEANDKFRAVHDAFGHAAIGRGFDRHGEEAAFQSHVEMFSPEAARAMTVETRGQNASLIYSPDDSFPPQKFFLLAPEYTTRMPFDGKQAPDSGASADRDNHYRYTRSHHTSLGRSLA